MFLELKSTVFIERIFTVAFDGSKSVTLAKAVRKRCGLASHMLYDIFEFI
jgi:hypothetical protein